MTEIMRNDAASISFDAFEAAILETDVLPPGDVAPVLLGLYGEVGGIMSAAKKHVREKNAYPGYRKAAVEEFGDTLWYLATLCKRIGTTLDALFKKASQGSGFSTVSVASDLPIGAVAVVAAPAATPILDETLFDLGAAASELLAARADIEALKCSLLTFARCYLVALHAAKLSFAEVARLNIAKTRGAFIDPDLSQLPQFDDSFEEEEQIPRQFRIGISLRNGGRSYLRWNGVFIGDPLTDNIADSDGYRFHDVLHLAYAAILHWSPVFRALIKQKRKSRPEFDENEDGGRAIVVEEGVTAWIFTRAKELDYFAGQDRISFGMLKSVQEFVTGFEVAQCPLKLWERAILDGYAVFRKIRQANGGWIVGDRDCRSIHFEPL
ncbi:conserved hypothetical protein [Methylocella tundrae]|uniref:MazG C-terminal domain-containing protein n=1 Tax=Methylocella tundrae TaxID=227605 RepID=A0A8B6M815_METTU|nr:nucleoside triphosphate pyrophosphohydrolase family protein [Methylocella tundrae]VTZ51173.1 conserved hypothetical protein [Methylocella tundrae]